MTLVIREPQPEDRARVAANMRAIDREECRAVGMSPWQGVHTATTQSALCWTGEVDGWPEAMFGVVGSAATGFGHPWFLGSEIARKQQRAFLREAPKYLARIETIFPQLTGFVAAENTTAHRWLKRMGFTVEDWYQVKMNDVSMMRFTKGF